MIALLLLMLPPPIFEIPSYLRLDSPDSVIYFATAPVNAGDYYYTRPGSDTPACPEMGSEQSQSRAEA
jgi:hypothetical protein